MDTTVLLVRHGQTRSNVTGFYMGWSDEDLDGTGRAQVESLAARLAKQHIAAIYTSPLKRTCTTAAILGRPHKLQPVVLDDVVEIRLGEWQGLHVDEVKARWPELWRQSRLDPSSVAFPNGESFPQVTERAVRVFQKVVAANQGQQAIIVSHEIVVKTILAHVLGISNVIYRRFVIGNASISRICLTDGKALVVTVNDTAHLETGQASG